MTKIINKVTSKNLIKNKRRTLVTIIGVIISVAMITAVLTIGTSVQSLLLENEKQKVGNVIAKYYNVNSENFEKIKKDENIKDITIYKNDVFLRSDKITTKFKPYLGLWEFNKKGFETYRIKLSEGRLPENSGEIVISKQATESGGFDVKAGDVIELDSFTCMNVSSGQNIDVKNKIDKMPEDIIKINETGTKKYKVCGIMEKPSWEHSNSGTYSAITYYDEDIKSGDSVTLGLNFKKLSRDIFGETEKISTDSGCSYSLNRDILRWQGIEENADFNATMYAFIGIILLIIMIGSISLIYNAFAISVSDRSKQLGMLSSVGATRAQKRKSVFFEGIVIGAVSIPLGLLAGVGGIAVTFKCVNPIFEKIFFSSSETSNIIKLSVKVNIPMIIAAIAVSILTIFISIYIPAKRASKISPIDAIRQTRDVKLTGRKVKTSKLTRKIFGIEADIALKNLKRNKKRYRATVISLIISVVLFLSVTTFTGYLNESAAFMKDDCNFDICVMHVGENYNDVNKIFEELAENENVRKYNIVKEYNTSTSISKENIPEYFRENADENIMAPDENGNYFYSLEINFISEKQYKSLAERHGISYDMSKPEAIALKSIKNYRNKAGDFKQVDAVNFEKVHSVNFNYDGAEKEIKLIGAVDDEEIMGLYGGSIGLLTVFMPEKSVKELGIKLDISSLIQFMYIKTGDSMQLQKDIQAVSESAGIDLNVNNVEQNAQNNMLVTVIFSVFIYGFIILITLICVANIFNTISTSIALRKKEFAMLKSVGMTPRGFNKMIRYESIFYGLKTLLYGLPISFGIMLIMSRSISNMGFSFYIPWLAVLIAVFGVFAVVGVTMLYSSSKVKKQNIVDGLKDENI